MRLRLTSRSDTSIDYVDAPIPPVLDPAEVDPATVRECDDITDGEIPSPSLEELAAAGRAERLRRQTLARHPGYDPKRAATLDRILNARYSSGGAA